jgi:hypothetical protein
MLTCKALEIFNRVATGGGDYPLLNLGEKRFGEACSIREVLEDKARLLPEFPNLSSDMEFFYLMFDLVGNHSLLINPFENAVKSFFIKLKKVLL